MGLLNWSRPTLVAPALTNTKRRHAEEDSLARSRPPHPAVVQDWMLGIGMTAVYLLLFATTWLPSSRLRVAPVQPASVAVLDSSLGALVWFVAARRAKNGNSARR